MDNVQGVTCKFGVSGRIFSFGDIEIESAGTYGKIVFEFPPSPAKLRDEVSLQARAKRLLTKRGANSNITIGVRYNLQSPRKMPVSLALGETVGFAGVKSE